MNKKSKQGKPGKTGKQGSSKRSLPGVDKRLITRISATKLTIGLPFNLGSLEFENDDVQQKVAWSLYVEISTRIPLGVGYETFRDMLSSLYSLFNVTREILREVGPEVAAGPRSLGNVVIDILNEGIRPFLSKWHPLLKAHEEKRQPNISVYDYEQSWEHAEELRKDITHLQEQLVIYKIALEIIAGISD